MANSIYTEPTHKIRDVLVLLLYKFSFDLIYTKNISTIYAYSGFTFELSILKYLILTFFFLLIIKPTIALYYSPKTSSMAILLFTFLYFVPGLTYISFIDVDYEYILFYLLYWVLMLFWNRYMGYIKIPKLKKGAASLLFYIYLSLVFLIVVYVSGKFTGFRLHFNLSDVYELRAEERIMNFPQIFRYCIPIVSITIPFLVMYFLVERKKIIVGILVFLQLLMFGIGGHKSCLFSLFLTLFVYFFYKKKRFVFIGLGFLSLNIIVLVEGYFRQGYSIVAPFIQNRVQLLPNQISYYIYDFMQNNELLYLRESILRLIGCESPYDRSIYFIIGDIYYGNSFVRANTGACGDAFSQFGFMSLLLYPMLIPLAFSVLGSVLRGLDDRIVFIVVFLYVSVFINGSFFSVLLTNGFLVTCFVLYFLSSKLMKNKSH